ncbi:hypothetical protein F7725_012530 [Dissostichus mawsoni]|uniref:aspartate transaminase n=1 Tax=Dissostichus mawsoni TaxID=36200 RepID=A0A7J5YR41_DISMA|nr:hypothetical protein F7725_012530 [Dissostichus mawsoni]
MKKMNLPDSKLNETEVKQNGDPGGQLSVFTNVHTAAGSPEKRLLSAFKKDTNPGKAYLAGREYYSEDGKTFELRLVRRIKQQLSADPTTRPEYPSPLGLTEFTRRATEVALGKSSRAIVEERVLGVQTPGFTAAVRLGAELLRNWYDHCAAWCGPVYLSSPCDDSLAGIFQAAGIQDIREYYYWDDQQRGVCLDKLLEDLEKAPERSALCYGNVEREAWPVQYCASQGMELLCEAVGHLLCVLKQNSLLLSVQSQAATIVKSLWAQPSAGGANIVATVLSNPAHVVEW